MSNNELFSNGVNESGTSWEALSPGRCSTGQQRGPGRQPATARMKWSKDVNKVVMRCYLKSDPVNENGAPIRGYRKRMFRIWQEIGPFESTEQRVCDQARAIRKNGWLSEVEIELLKRQIEIEDCTEVIESDSFVENEDTTGDVDNVYVSMQQREMDNGNDTVRLLNVDERDGLSEEDELLIAEILEVYRSDEKINVSFKRANQQQLKNIIKEVNNVMDKIPTSTITETNDLVYAVCVYTAKKLRLKSFKGGPKKDPWWKRRIEQDITRIRRDLNVLQRELKGQVRNRAKVEELENKYHIKSKKLNTVIEELKQRLVAKAAKIKRYEQRGEQFKQNQLFNQDQKRFYQQLNGNIRYEGIIPDVEASKTFWSEIWSKGQQHNNNAEWLRNLRTDLRNQQQENVIITKEMVTKQCTRMPNWKAPGMDGVQGFWLKKLTSLHERIAEQLSLIVDGDASLPQWLTLGRTILCLKDPKKGNAVDNFRPISCLPMMWKLLTGVIADGVYEHLERNELLPEEQKGCRRGTRGTKDQLLIDKAILMDCKRRHTHMAMAWIDYKKAYDMVPHSWVVECLEMFGIAKNVREFLKDSMQSWRTELTSCGHMLGTVNINRGIFQGDSLSPLLFVLCMIPLSLVLRKVKAGYVWGANEVKTNHLLYMDDVKLYGKSYDQIETLVETVHTVSKDIGMEFGIKKCGMLLLKRGKVVSSEGVSLPDGQIMKEIDDTGYKYLGILEYDKLKEKKMKDVFTAEYKRRIKLVLKSKLNGKNKILAINSWAVAVLRYSFGVLDWKKEELTAIDRMTRKVMTMHGALHPKSDVDRVYVSRCNGGRGLISAEMCARTEENNLASYVKMSTDNLVKGVKIANIVDGEEPKEKNAFKREIQNEYVARWTGKRMYGQFVREMPENVDRERTWEWMRKSDLKVETEALIFAAQEQALRTNAVKCNIDKTKSSPLCRLCGEKSESVTHIVCGCTVLAQKEYKRRHDNIARIVHWKLCGKYDLKRVDKWYEHHPEGAIESETVKILWDMTIQCDHYIEARRPDILVVEKSSRKALIIDIASSGDQKVGEKENEKIEKYQDLKREIMKLWNLRRVEVIPVVVGALGSVSKKIGQYLEQIGIDIRIGLLQKTALLGTARILRKVLET